MLRAGSELTFRATHDDTLGRHIVFRDTIDESNFISACETAINLARALHAQELAVVFVAKGIEVQLVQSSDAEVQYALWKRRATPSEELTLAQVLDLVREHLLSQGWSMLEGPAVANKFFETAVGPKEALCWLNKGSVSYVLSGQYYSEGRNILEASTVLIPQEANLETAMHWIAKFARNVEKTIADSYAVRLLPSR